MQYNFNEILDRTNLSTSKWEYEIDRKKDNSLLSFGTADMDFKSAQPIIKAMKDVAESGHFGYPYKGESYYKSVVDFFKRRFNWEIKKEWIATNVGIYPSMQTLIDELTEPGDEIIYQTPVHHIFEELITSNNRVAKENPLISQGDTYTIDFEGFRNSISSKTKLLLLCNPHNPMGRLWEKDELMQLNEICLEHGIIVVSDEVYCGLIYKDKKFIPMASISEEASMNTITLVSASKSFNITGLKHSLVITENKDLLQKYNEGLKKNNLHYGGSIFGQVATEAAFDYCDDWSYQVMDYIEGNFKFVEAFMNKNFPEVKVYTPQSTYFVWIDFSSWGISDDELVSFFEDKAHIIVSAGYIMGQGGSGHIRLNIGCPRSILEEGLLRIKEAYAQSC